MMYVYVQFPLSCLLHTVNILLRNERNMKQTDYSHFTVDSLSEIITLMSTIMTVPFKQEP